LLLIFYHKAFYWWRYNTKKLLKAVKQVG